MIATRPSRRSVALWPNRGTTIGWPAVNDSVVGSQISLVPMTGCAMDLPPAISTRPSSSSVAECCQRGVDMSATEWKPGSSGTIDTGAAVGSAIADGDPSGLVTGAGVVTDTRLGGTGGVVG